MESKSVPSPRRKKISTKKKARKWLWLKFRKGDHSHNLLVAAQRWVHANGGTAVVLGGIGLMDGPMKYRYNVVISATGTKPSKEKGRYK